MAKRSEPKFKLNDQVSFNGQLVCITKVWFDDVQWRYEVHKEGKKSWDTGIFYSAPEDKLSLIDSLVNNPKKS